MKRGLSLKQNMLWNTIGGLIWTASQWLLTVVVVRISGYGDAGNLSLAISATNMFYCIAIFGMRTFQVSDVENRFQTGTYLSSRIVTCLLSFVTCSVFALIGNYTWEQRAIILAYMVFRIAEAVFDSLNAIFQKNERLDQSGRSMIVRGIAFFLAFLLLQMLFQNLIISILGMAVVCVVVIVLWDLPFARKLESTKLVWDFSPLKTLLLACLPFAMCAMIDTSIVSIPRLFLENYHGNETLGYYTSVAAPTVIVQVLASFIFTPFVKLFAQYYYENRPKDFGRLFVKIIGAIIAVTIAGVFVCYFFGDWGLSLVFGESILPYTYLLVPAFLCAFLIAIIQFFIMIFTIIRQSKLLLAINVVTIILSLALSAFIVLPQGMQGVNVVLGIALSVEIILMFIGAFVSLRKHFREEKVLVIMEEGK